ncbi:hypothetical protein CPEBRM1_ABPJDJAI_02604 (plasmid) [Companilactobacillus paralimentarius]
MPFFVIKKGLVLLEWKYFPTPKILDPNLSSLQSPQFDSVSSHSNVNTQENNIISSMQAQEYVKETYDIINKSPRIYKIILKNRSLLHFAEMFQGIYDLNDYSYTDNDLKRV